MATLIQRLVARINERVNGSAKAPESPLPDELLGLAQKAATLPPVAVPREEPKVPGSEGAPPVTNDLPDEVRAHHVITSAKTVLEQELPGHAIMIVDFGPPPRNFWWAVWTLSLSPARLTEILLSMANQSYAKIMRTGGN